MSWDDLNKRRVLLIEAKRMEVLSEDEAKELSKLQKIAGLIRDYSTPPFPKELQASIDAQFDWEHFNPDAMMPEEVRDWADYILRSDLMQLAYDMTKHIDYKVSMPQACILVIHAWLYLITKSLAMSYRLNGHIEYALRHEEVCQMIYNAIPKEVRW